MMIELLLLLISLALLAVSSAMYLRAWAFVSAARRTTGNVIALTPDEEEEVFFPVVEFTADDGVTRRVRGKVGRKPPAHKVGDTVSILYHPQRPDDMRINTFGELWLPSLIALGASGLFTLICVLLVIF